MHARIALGGLLAEVEETPILFYLFGFPPVRAGSSNDTTREPSLNMLAHSTIRHFKRPVGIAKSIF
jgi:hypothetical protein